jgi:hypothetical protein
MGLGSLEVRVPREAGIRLERDAFLTSFNAPGLERQGDVYLTSNWEQASLRIFVGVDAAIGSISIIRFDP